MERQGGWGTQIDTRGYRWFTARTAFSGNADLRGRDRHDRVDFHGTPYRGDELAFDIESMRSLRKIPAKCLADGDDWYGNSPSFPNKFYSCRSRTETPTHSSFNIWSIKLCRFSVGKKKIKCLYRILFHATLYLFQFIFWRECIAFYNGKLSLSLIRLSTIKHFDFDVSLATPTFTLACAVGIQHFSPESCAFRVRDSGYRRAAIGTRCPPSHFSKPAYIAAIYLARCLRKNCAFALSRRLMADDSLPSDV